MLQVSVIIPVFNVASYLEEAVMSALIQPEVAEIILVEDGSTDSSLEVCVSLADKHEKVRVLRHPNGGNRGVCHSRNLGIKSARFDVIAFLDGDDWYLPNRFKREAELFNDPQVMAVFSLSATRYSNGREELFGDCRNFIDELSDLDTKAAYCQIMQKDIVLGHTNANTFRSSVFEMSGLFDERLNLHQDTELWNRIARKFSFVPGEITKPVSIARRHGKNRITGKSRNSVLKMLFVWVDNIGVENLYPCETQYFIHLYARAHTNWIGNDLVRRISFHVIRSTIAIFPRAFIRSFYRSYPRE